MLLLEELALKSRLTKYGNYSALKYLEDVLRAVEFPDVEGVQIKSFAPTNLVGDGEGNFTINNTTGRAFQTITTSLALTDDDFHSQQILFCFVGTSPTIVLPAISDLTMESLPEITIIHLNSETVGPIITANSADKITIYSTANGITTSDDGGSIQDSGNFAVTHVLYKDDKGWLAYTEGVGDLLSITIP